MDRLNQLNNNLEYRIIKKYPLVNSLQKYWIDKILKYNNIYDFLKSLDFYIFANNRDLDFFEFLFSIFEEEIVKYKSLRVYEYIKYLYDKNLIDTNNPIHYFNKLIHQKDEFYILILIGIKKLRYENIIILISNKYMIKSCERIYSLQYEENILYCLKLIDIKKEDMLYIYNLMLERNFISCIDYLLYKYNLKEEYKTYGLLFYINEMNKEFIDYFIEQNAKIYIKTYYNEEIKYYIELLLENENMKIINKINTLINK